MCNLAGEPPYQSATVPQDIEKLSLFWGRTQASTFDGGVLSIKLKGRCVEPLVGALAKTPDERFSLLVQFKIVNSIAYFFLKNVFRVFAIS
jgi:hypothetical protein